MLVNFCPFPVIETESLLLRRMGQQDVADLFAMRSDPRMHEDTDTMPDLSMDETKVYIDRMNKGIDANAWIIWAIEHRQTGKVIGTVSIWNFNAEQVSGELGYGIMPAYQGRGLMREALSAIIEYGFFVLQLQVLEAYTEEKNARSRGLLQRCGFSEVDRVEEEGYMVKRTFNMVVYRRQARQGDGVFTCKLVPASQGRPHKICGEGA